MRDGVGLQGSFEIEAPDLDLGEEECPDGLPMAEVTWPDGRIDSLTHTCADCDIGPAELLDNCDVLLHAGFFNDNAQMVGYVSVDFGHLRDDVFYARAGDIEERQGALYFRGTRRQAIECWLGLVGGYCSPWPFTELILCSHYWVLQDVRTYEDGFGANLFTEDPTGYARTVILDFSHDLTKDEMDWLAGKLEAEGCTWPRSAAQGDKQVSAAWAERVSKWEDDEI